MSSSCTQAVKLWLTVGTDNSYHLALFIPLEDFQLFTRNPFAWLRYVASTIHGREGHISLTPHGTEIDDDDHIEPKEYYYVSQDLALLLDPALMDDRTSITTAESTAESTASQDDFSQRVTDRDGACVLTGCGENLTACHIVPHAKTHQYMANLANYRGGNAAPLLDDINDTRNGILLYSSFHHAFGESRVAFLRTPNFAMAVTDVDRVARRPGVYLQPLGTERVTFQHFRTNDLNLALLAPHSCDATIADSDQWPPDLIFDVAYGCAALAKWGTRQFIHFAQKTTYEIYYGQGDRNGNDGNMDDKIPDNSQPQQTSGHAERSATRRAAGGIGQASIKAAPGVPDFHDMILGLWMSSAKKDQRRAESAKMDRTKKEVQAWLGSVE